MRQKDFSRMKLGTKTRNGEITVCAKCGLKGAHMTFTVPDGQIFEQWIHLLQGRGLFLNQVFSCSRQIGGPPVVHSPHIEESL